MPTADELRQKAITATKRAEDAWHKAKYTGAYSILNALRHVFLYGNAYLPQLKAAVDDFVSACEDESD